DSHAMLMKGLDWAVTKALPDEGSGSRVGVIVSDRAPMGPLAQTVLAVARELRLPSGFRPV
ncbi:MAG: LysR family transcriptional regulator, partial [Sphingobium sp.]